MLPLSKDQKAHICRLAKQAYDDWLGREGFEECNPTLSRSVCFEAWRRCEQTKAVGVPSLTRCTSERHYRPLVAHFSAMVGDGDGALRSLLRHAEESRIVVFYKLQQALAERGLAEGYAAAICRRQFKCALGDASEKQLWSLLYTIRNRRKAVAPEAQYTAPTHVNNDLGTLTATAGSAGISNLKSKISNPAALAPRAKAAPRARAKAKAAPTEPALRAAMAAAVADERYEDAATIRDQLAALTAPTAPTDGNPF